MEGGPKGASSGAICGNLQQIVSTSTLAGGSSLVARVDEGANLEGKMAEEMELDEFETFKSFRAIRILKNKRQLQKKKEWDRILVHIDQTEDSNEEEKEESPRGKRLSKDEEDVDRLSNTENT
ncbi:unnamed protein product [Lactuca saligna]|uniref:Uncharacterized protein n=1 Tax=Lactuca saligna TaxID=75948 RepID=A0AA35ZSE7_LACSI|nr:unnamed protein product [Lactuca saligna]